MAKEQVQPKKQGRGEKLNASERELIKTHITDLYLKGWSYRKMMDSILKTFNQQLSISSVHNYVTALIDEWRAQRVSKLDDLKTVELQKINRLEETYWDAWIRSMEAAKRIAEKMTANEPEKGKRVRRTMKLAEKTISVEETTGDPRYLQGIQWCVAMRCKILGVEAPIEFKGTMTSEIKRTTIFKTRSRQKPE